MARAKKDGDDAVAASEEYRSSQKTEDNKYETITHCRYFYKDEKAFGGTEYGENILGIQGHPEVDDMLPELFDFLTM